MSLCAGLAVGCMSTPSTTATVGPSAPTAIASPAISPTGSASPTPAATLPGLGLGERALDAGTYRLELNRIDAGGTKFLASRITLPEGWNNINGAFLNTKRSVEDTGFVAVQFWSVDRVYKHPCQWNGTLFRPGPTVDALAEALVERPLRHATQPINVTLDGYAGKYLEWSVPADTDFSKCDRDGGKPYFESWTGSIVGDDGDRYQQAPGQVDRLWILDINGARLVIDAFSMPSTTSEEVDGLLDVVKSIRFER